MGRSEKEVTLPSRARQALDKDAEIYYPPLPAELSYLVEYLRRLDFIEPGMAGPVRLSFTEIRSWAVLCGIQLKPWEVDMLRQMSTEFVSEVNAAESPLRPAPWMPSDGLQAKVAIARRIKDVLRGA